MTAGSKILVTISTKTGMLDRSTGAERHVTRCRVDFCIGEGSQDGLFHYSYVVSNEVFELRTRDWNTTSNPGR